MPREDRNHLIEDGYGDNQSNASTGEVSESNVVSNDQASENPIVYTSQLAALFIIVNITVGLGLLALPYTYQHSGIVTSFVAQGFFLTLIIITCIMCTELTVKTNVKSYHELVAAHCSPFVFHLSQLCILQLTFGTVVAFIVTIGDQTDRVYDSLNGQTFCHTWYLNRKFSMLVATFFLSGPLCTAKNVDFLKYVSFAGVASLGFIIYMMVSEFSKQAVIAPDVAYFPTQMSDFLAVFPVFCLGYQVHLSQVPVVATMRKEEKRKTYITIIIAMLISTVFYVVSVTSTLTFGSKIKEDLTESYSGRSWVITTTIGIVAFKCLVTLPGAFLPCRLGITDLLDKRIPPFASLSETKKRFLVSYGTLTMALLIAIFLPDILVAIDFLGSLSVLFVFLLPCACYLNLVKQNRLQKQEAAGNSSTVPSYTTKDKFKITTSYALIIFGFIMGILVFYTSILKLSKKSSPPLCS